LVNGSVFHQNSIIYQYILVYYYAIMNLIGGDLVPTSETELLS